MLLLVGVSMRQVWRYVNVSMVFITHIKQVTKACMGKANWAGVADKVCNQFFLVRLPFLRVQELIDACVGMFGGFESFETWGGESLGVRISVLGIFEMVNDLINIQHAFFELVAKLDHHVGPFTMLLGDGGHFINKVIVKDGTFDRFLAKENWGKDWNEAQSNVVGFGPGC
jgi:hypothetical protein